MVVGEVVTLGRHRLMCGDSGNPEHVAALMGGAKADLIFTSPPYAQQRRYVSGIGDWDTLMQRVFGALPAHEKTQVLVNLGLVHRDGEWQPYWNGWIQWMREQGWRRFGWYVWNKMEAVPGDHNGRLAPSFEWLFHFNRQRRYPNKTVPCKHVGGEWSRANVQRGASGRPDARRGTRVVSSHKIGNAVVSVYPEKGAVRGCGHPAMFPIALPTEIIRAYTDPGEVTYEPFAGSGTTILAAEREGRTCYAMEVEPSYCDIAVERFAKACAQPPLAIVS